ncbi:hypothetical protein SLEP1_g49102 [Rubroshorea leprosula]|uniref:RNase H type-1 domain-containing protein n=1 Tax=Rubroshorea leprosula TaxID=152421 RepID=A0AAV5LW07_9ROSI|nr:hypothetical protein SLEP1_g49102 [Rubroshorea leprosula]
MSKLRQAPLLGGEGRFNAIICQWSVLKNIIVILHKFRDLNLPLLYVLPEIELKMVLTFIGNRPPRGSMDDQDNTQLLESDLNDIQIMSRNLFVGEAEQEQSNTSDDERTPIRYATQLEEQFHISAEAKRRHSRHNTSRPERPMKSARMIELEERTRVLEMAMGKILSRLIPNDPLIPLLNKGEQLATIVATRNSPALSNVVILTRPRGSGKLNPEPSSSRHNEELLKKNANLERQLKDVQRSIGELKSPRSRQQTYDGLGDPDEHLHTYQAIMRIQNATDAMMCKVFLATLKSTARSWYHKLPRHSITSYSKLATLFSNKFASQREIKRTATELMQVHQKEGESLRDHMQRFNKSTLDIDNVPDTICMFALLHGLKLGRFLDDLLENPPKSWNEVNDSGMHLGGQSARGRKAYARQDLLFSLVQREGSNVETQENDPDYVPSQRSTSVDNINTLKPTLAFSVPHWNFRPRRLAHVSHTWTRGSTSANTPELASRVQAQHHCRGDEPTQANSEDKTMIANRKAQLSCTRDSLKERNETLQKDMETLRQQMAELRMAQQQATDAPQIASIEHVRSYKLAMMIYRASDALLCRVFLSTLKKAAQTWQKTDESLRAYIARFHNESLQVDNLDEGVAMHALMNGLKDCDFLHSLNRERPKSLKDILHRSKGYIRVEERAVAKKGGESLEPNSVVVGNKKRRFDRSNDIADVRGEKRGVVRNLKNYLFTLQEVPRVYTTFTPLNTSMVHILTVAKETEHLNWPKKLRSNGNKCDKTRHCAFHGIHGHDTKDFPPSATLASMALAVKGSNESQPSTQTITFIGKDLDQREVFPHDPLMIEIVVEDRNLRKGKVMKRVLVDTGSCRDVMCYGAFKKLGVFPQLLRPCDFPLVGLSRKSVPVKGIISLPIHVGVPPCVAVVTLDFFVIDVPSPFNAILGCPRLNSLQVMVSTQAMMIKFPTPNGVGMARGKLVEVVEEKTLTVDNLDMREELKECRTEPINQVKPVVLDEKRPERLVNIGVDMDSSFMARLENCLREHKDIFAWCPLDMPDLNKVCPKDNYPLPNIDELVDNSSGYVVLSLCDAYSGYNQIPMAKEDRDKTAFIAVGATYCYVVMPFGLKNARATYQSKSLDQHIEDLKQVFEVLKTHNMKLNPTKCTFGVKARKFLGFMLTSRGIEVNLEKIRVVLEMKPPSLIKEVQKLMGKVVALSRVVPGEKLYQYIAVSTEAISVALVREDGSKQEPVYYVKKVYYFLGHTIVVLTNYPLRQILQKPDLVGRLVRWSIELIEFELEFQPWRVMKAQVLAGFIAELSKEEKVVMLAPPIDVPCKRKAPKPKKPTKNLPSNLVWNLYVDGSSNAAGSGAGIILIFPEGETFECALKFNFEASNNRVECEALLKGLRLAKAARVEYLRIYSDSQLIVNQVNGDFIAIEQVMAQYLSVTMQFLQSFQGYELSQVRRSENLKADALAKLASTGLGVSGVEVYIETLSSPSIEMENALPTHEEQSWIDPILTFLKSGILPEDEKEAKKLRRKAAWFASVAYLESNGQVEVENKAILESLKKKVGSAKGTWTEELPYTLWAYRTTYKTPTGETLFNLTYGSEAVVSVEVKVPNYRTNYFNANSNEQALRENLDLLDESRDLSQIRVAHYHRRMEKYYNSKVRPKGLHQGDWVLRKVEVIERNSYEGKLCPSWEGPYLIQKDLGNGAFKLVKPSGTPIPRAWNAAHLKKYYQ